VDGQWKETYVRVGEAKNPGPAKDAIRATWGAFGAQLPHCGGFRDAVAPGFADPERGAPDGDGKLEPYVLRIATANVTAWSSAITYLHETQADILLVQEHKLGECQAEEAVSWLRRRGWNAVMTPAVPGPNGGLSAGTAVLARSHIGLGLPLVGAETVVPGRAVAARIEAPGYRPMTVLSLYLHDGVGLDKTNLEVLRQVGAFLAAQGDSQPFVVGGTCRCLHRSLRTLLLPVSLGPASRPRAMSLEPAARSMPRASSTTSSLRTACARASMR
jgi:hypothetical protein